MQRLNKATCFMKKITVREFRIILRKFERELSKQDNSSSFCGISMPQCHTILELGSEKPQTVNEIAQSMNLDKSTVSRTVERLVKENLVQREIPPENRRITQVSLTNQGVSLFNTINGLNDDFFQKSLDAIPKENLEVFIDSFKRFANEMAKLNLKK